MVFKSHWSFISFVRVNFSDITVLEVFTLSHIAVNISIVFLHVGFVVLNTYKKFKLIVAD